MATRSASSQSLYPNSVLTTWTGLLNSDDGQPAGAAWYPDKTVQVFGTFGSGGSVAIEGSLDGTNWATLTDQSGSALIFTSAGIGVVLQNVPFIRPRVTAGDATTNLTVKLLMVGR